uniref:Uncharacterized protein n=1 Tax=Oryza nivara TaxID=4536 RepID=A0A0E0HTR4_ORYNI
MVDKRSDVVDGVVMCHAVRTGLVPTPKPHADPVRVAETLVGGGAPMDFDDINSMITSHYTHQGKGEKKKDQNEEGKIKSSKKAEEGGWL